MPFVTSAEAVIVLGTDTPIGLTIIRELGQHGVQVHGVGRSRRALGAWSRHITSHRLRAEGDEALCRQLQELAAATGSRCVMAISESDLMWLNRHRAALEPLNLLIPSQEALSRVIDKSLTVPVAQSVGIDVPVSVQIHSIDELPAALNGLRFPVVLKWADPNAAGPSLRAIGLALDKSHYCYDAAEVKRYLQPYAISGLFPLIQEYCPGYGLGHFIYMHAGQALLRFQHRRVREWPPEGGVSCTCDAVPLTEHSALMERSVELLRQLDWEGVAMVEYRYDPGSERAAFMEVNGRFWGSLPLAWHCGAAFAWLTYAVGGRGQVLACTPTHDDLRCRFLIPEFKRLLRILFSRDAIPDRTLRFRPARELAEFFLDFVHPRVRYYVFAWSDPMPFFADVAGAALDTLRGLLARCLSARPPHR